MKKCCEETTRYLTRLFNMKEWQDAKENKCSSEQAYRRAKSLPKRHAPHGTTEMGWHLHKSHLRCAR